MKTSVFAFLLCLPIWVLAQVQFIAEADRYRISTEDILRVSYTIEGEGSAFQTPNFAPDFMLLSGPNRSFQSSIVNGRIRSNQSFQYALRPTRKGILKVPSAKIRFNGAFIESKELEIEVIAASERQAQPKSPASKAKESAFIRIIASKRKAYVGEPIVLDYILYYQEVDQPRAIREPEFRGYYLQKLDLDEKERYGKEVVNGIRYNTAVLNRILIVPQLSNAKIEGSYECTVPTIIRTNRRDIFGRPAGEIFNQQLSVVPPSIEIKSLPMKSKPAQFDGAVGSFQLALELSKSEVEADESVSLRLTIKGKGNLSMIELPELEFPNEFEVFDPVVKDEIRIGNRGIEGKRYIEYLLVPRYKGTYKIPSLEWAYFDPAKEQYIQLSTEEQEITVIGGASAPGRSGSSVGSAEKQSLTTLENDIRFIATETESWSKKGEHSLAIWRWMNIALPILIFIILLIVRSFQKKNQHNSHQRAASKAYRLAVKEIGRIQSVEEKSASDQINQILEQYLRKRFGLQASEMAAEQIEQKFLHSKVDAEAIQELLQLRTDIQAMHYSPMASNLKIKDRLLLQLKKLEGALKIALIAFFLSIGFSGSLSAQQNAFDTANAYYQQEDYSQAIAAYDSLLAQDWKSADLYYNLGNAYFRSGELGESIWAYRMALRVDPKHRDAEFNLELTRSLRVDEIESVPIPFVERYFMNLAKWLGHTGFALLLSFSLWGILIGCILWMRQRRSGQIYIISFFSILAIFATLCWALYTGVLSSVREAVVVSDNVYVRSAPDNNAPDIFVLHEGTELSLEERIEEWQEIRLSDGQVGWLPVKTIEIIE